MKTSDRNKPHETNGKAQRAPETSGGSIRRSLGPQDEALGPILGDGTFHLTTLVLPGFLPRRKTAAWRAGVWNIGAVL